MSEELEVIRGSGHLFRDLGYPDADVEEMKAILAAHIIGTLDRRGLTVRAAAELTGVAAADFSRVRRVKLSRFTIDRLIAMLNKLGRRVDVEVHVEDAPKVEQQNAA